MPIDAFFIRSIVVLRAQQAQDRYGAGQRDWRVARAVWQGLGWLALEGSQWETDVNREEAKGGMWLYLPPEADITYTDRVTVDGRLFQVTGNPAQAFTPQGEHHLEVKVESISG